MIKRVWTVIHQHILKQRFAVQSDIQKLIDNASWLFADKLLRMLLGFFVSVWIVRYLGPEQFGIFSYALAFASLFSGLATLGLDGIVVRDIVRYPDQKGVILGTTFILKLLGGVLALATSVLVISFIRPGEPLMLWLVGLTSAGTVFQAVDVIDLWFQSQVCSRYTVFARSSAFLLTSIVKIILVQIKSPLIAFAWVGLAEFVICALCMIVIYRQTCESNERWRINRPLGLRLLQQSWPLLFAYISYMVYMRIDQVMIGNMLNDSAVGMYSAATRIFDIPLSLIVIVASSCFPFLTKLYYEDNTSFYRRYYQITYIMTLVSIILLPTVLLLGKQFITTLFGNVFAGAYDILIIQIVGLIFLSNAVLRSSYLTITGNQRIIFITTTISAVLNIILNYALIPLFGVHGAAIATTLTQLISLVLFNIAFKETNIIFKIQLYALFLKSYKSFVEKEYTNVST